VQIEIAILISIISVSFSVYFGLVNNKRSSTKDTEERIRNDTKINVKLDSIGVTTQEIRNDIGQLKSNIHSHNERLLVVEQSVKAAHQRMDDFSKNVGGDNKWRLRRKSG
jgi:hypothetical protein